MRIASGVTDQYIYFVAVDSLDLVTRKTGLSSFTVYRSRNGGAAAAFTTPTVNETDATNMPGVYELLLDEDMSIDAGDETQEMVLHITATGMAPVTRTFELYRPKITVGATLGVESDGDLTKVNAVDGLAAADVGAIKAVTDALPDAGALTSLATATALATVDANVDAILEDTGTTLPGALATIAGYIDTEIAALISAVGTVDTVVDGIKAVTDNLPDGGALSSLATASALATVDGIVDAILVDTAEIGAAGAGLGAIPWNAAWDAEVQSEAADALNAYDPPTHAELTARTLAAADYATAAALATVDGVADAILEDTGTTLPGGLAALEGKVDTVDGVADAIKAKTDQLGFGVTGKVDANLTHVNEVEVAGDGSEGTPWGPA